MQKIFTKFNDLKMENRKNAQKNPHVREIKYL